jgi:hypothetical protein
MAARPSTGRFGNALTATSWRLTEAVKQTFARACPRALGLVFNDH